MKKGVVKNVLLFLFALAFFSPIVKAEKFVAGESITSVPIYLDKITKKSYRYFKPAYRSSDNTVSYCVEPEKVISTTKDYEKVTKNQWERLNVSKEKWDRLTKIAYFGYGYQNHTDIKWNAITQYLIWQEVLPNNWFLTFTDGYEGEFKNVWENETNEIMSLIDDFEKSPNIPLNINVTKNKEKILTDNNEILNKYSIINENKDIDVKIIDNKLHITAKKNGDYKITLKRGEFKETSLYLASGSQGVLTRDGKIENSIQINISVKSGNLIIKRERDNYLYNESTNYDALYEITDSENNKYTVSTDQEGVINLIDLPTGNVKVKEITPSVGYYKDENIYVDNIKSDDTTIINIIPKLIKKNVYISKKYYLKNDNLLRNEIGSIFSLHKDEKFLKLRKTNKDGIVMFEIPYGHYRIMQNTSKEGYELMKDYNIFVTNDEDENLQFVNYPINEEEPIVIVKEKEVPVIVKEEVEVVKEIEVIKEIPVEKEIEVIKEIPVEKEIEVIKTIDPNDYIEVENPHTGDDTFKNVIKLGISALTIVFFRRKMQ